MHIHNKGLQQIIAPITQSYIAKSANKIMGLILTTTLIVCATEVVIGHNGQSGPSVQSLFKTFKATLTWITKES
jgi:hypothetical protein